MLGEFGCGFVLFGLGLLVHTYKVWTAVDMKGETAAAEMSYQDGLNLTPKQSWNLMELCED